MSSELFEKSVGLTLLVSDFDAAIDFYVKILDVFEVIRDDNLSSERRVELQFTGKKSFFVMTLYCPKSTEASFGKAGKQAEGLILLELPCELAKVRKRLSDHGTVPFDELELPYAEYVFVRDPFGNRISLFESPISLD